VSDYDVLTAGMLAHQVQALDFILGHPKAAIWISIGGAKTRIASAALKLLRPPGHTLVIAPLQVCANSWPAELAKWGISANLRSFVTDLDPASKRHGKRLPAKARDAEFAAAFDPSTAPAVWLASRDQVTALVDRWQRANRSAPKAAASGGGGLWGMPPNSSRPPPATRSWPFPTVVIDESQDFKNPRAERTRALFKVRDQITRMIQLTGSPTPQDIGDLWSQVFLLDGGAALGGRFTDFRDRFFHVAQTIPDGHGGRRPVKWEPVDGALARIHRRCAHLAMSVETPVTTAPPVIRNRFVSIPPAAQKLYGELRRDLIIELAGRQIAADNAAVLRARLLQLASGTCYPAQSGRANQTSRERDYIPVHDAKIDALAQIIDAADTPVLVAYRFRSDSTRIRERLAGRGVPAEVFDGSPGMVRRWNDRLIPVMLLQPASSGRGLNLQYGGRHLVWFTLPDSSEHFSQTNGRLARLGQTGQVEITLLICENTIDEVLYPRLAGKLGSQAELLAAAAAYTQAQIDAALSTNGGPGRPGRWRG
jgi:hypothetical protein